MLKFSCTLERAGHWLGSLVGDVCPAAAPRHRWPDVSPQQIHVSIVGMRMRVSGTTSGDGEAARSIVGRKTRGSTAGRVGSETAWHDYTMSTYTHMHTVTLTATRHGTPPLAPPFYNQLCSCSLFILSIYGEIRLWDTLIYSHETSTSYIKAGVSANIYYRLATRRCRRI